MHINQAIRTPFLSPSHPYINLRLHRVVGRHAETEIDVVQGLEWGWLGGGVRIATTLRRICSASRGFDLPNLSTPT